MVDSSLIRGVQQYHQKLILDLVQGLISNFLVYCRCGRFPPEVRTAIPVEERFEHIVLSCNAGSDHEIIWIVREAEKALEVSRKCPCCRYLFICHFLYHSFQEPLFPLNGYLLKQLQLFFQNAFNHEILISIRRTESSSKVCNNRLWGAFDSLLKTSLS